QVEHEADALGFTFETRCANQYRHPAIVLANEIPFKRLQATGTLDLFDKVLTKTAEPLGRRQISPAHPARKQVLTLVPQQTEKCVVGVENGAVEIPNDDPDDVGVYQPPDLRLAFRKVAV